MRPLVFVVPGRLDTRTGGSIYDRRIVEGLRQRGVSVDIVELDGTFPFPDQRAVEHARERFASLGDGRIAIVDSLVLGALPSLVCAAANRTPIVALIHLPLAADPGMDAGVARSFEEGEGQALAVSSLIVVTGRATLSLLQRYSPPQKRVVVVEPGTDRKPVAVGSRGASLQLLCVATINSGKGHDVLLRALAQSGTAQWRLTCAGSLTRDPATVDRLRATIRALGLDDRVELAGELDDAELDRVHDRSDLFVLATLRETYGMAVAEALASGLPVVSTATGAIPTLVGDHAGIVVPPGDVTALADALRRVLDDASLRSRLSEGARLVREQLPTWDVAVDRFHDALVRMAPHG